MELHTTKYQCHSTLYVRYNNSINNILILGVFAILSQVLKLIGSFGQEMIWKYYVCSFICFEEDKRTQYNILVEHKDLNLALHNVINT
jgi:hypothetical protein